MSDDTPVLRADATDGNLNGGPVTKSEWIHYAIAHGEPKASAVKMTLAELRAKYGNDRENDFIQNLGNLVIKCWEPYENSEGGWSYRPVYGE